MLVHVEQVNKGFGFGSFAWIFVCRDLLHIPSIALIGRNPLLPIKLTRVRFVGMSVMIRTMFSQQFLF